MARLKPEPLVEPLRVEAGVMRQQLDQLASPGARLRDRPLHQLRPVLMPNQHHLLRAAGFGQAEIDALLQRDLRTLGAQAPGTGVLQA